MKFNHRVLTRWAKETADKAVERARKAGTAADDKELEAYRAGILTGYREAISAMKLHGAVQETYNF